MKSRREIVRVRDAMKTTFEVVDGMITVSEALRRMAAKAIRCVIVDKRHEDDEFGIVLLSDIAKQVLARDRSPDRVNVYEVMSKPVLSIDPHMDIRYCARFFDNFGLSHAPVIENDKVIGIISYTGLVMRGLYRGEGTDKPWP